MSELPSVETPSSAVPTPPPPPLNRWLTGIGGILAAAYLGIAMFTGPTSPLERLEQPEQSLERLATREMDIRDALRRAPQWERTLYGLFAGGEETPSDVIAWYDELLGTEPSPVAQLYRVVLLAEDGQTGRVSTALVPWEFQGESAFEMAQWIRAAYLDAPLDQDKGRAILAEIRSTLPPGWFADTLSARIASAMGDRAVEQQAESAIDVRGRALLKRWIVLIGMQLGLLAAGIGMLGRLLLRRTAVAVGNAPVPPPWTPQDGYGLFIRGVLGFLLMSAVASFLLPRDSPYNGVATLIAGLPLLLWLRRYLSVRGFSIAEAFGLRVTRGHLPRLAGATFVIIGLSVVGEVGITVVSGALQMNPHWADGFMEGLLWGPTWLAACEVLDSVVWAPLIEEIAFRGVLYATLRMTLGVWPAIGLSAAFFALVHGYGTIGFASVLWSGMLWAMAYERTRSLLPAMLGHMLNNLLVTTEFLWLLRL